MATDLRALNLGKMVGLYTLNRVCPLHGWKPNPKLGQTSHHTTHGPSDLF